MKKNILGNWKKTLSTPNNTFLLKELLETIIVHTKSHVLPSSILLRKLLLVILMKKLVITKNTKNTLTRLNKSRLNLLNPKLSIIAQKTWKLSLKLSNKTLLKWSESELLTISSNTRSKEWSRRDFAVSAPETFLLHTMTLSMNFPATTFVGRRKFWLLNGSKKNYNKKGLKFTRVGFRLRDSPIEKTSTLTTHKHSISLMQLTWLNSVWTSFS